VEFPRQWSEPGVHPRALRWKVRRTPLSVRSLTFHSPLKDPSILWKFTDELGIGIFGTSAKYIEQLSVSRSISDNRSSTGTQVPPRKGIDQRNTIH